MACIARQNALGLKAGNSDAATAGHVSGTMLRRMITLRNWVPDGDRPALDAAIRACRQKGVECAASKAVGVKGVVASSIDGSGAQSVFILIKEGRKHAAAALLLKQGIGVRDAWVRSDLSESEAEMFMYRVASELDIYDSDLDFARLALGGSRSVRSCPIPAVREAVASATPSIKQHPSAQPSGSAASILRRDAGSV